MSTQKLPNFRKSFDGKLKCQQGPFGIFGSIEVYKLFSWQVIAIELLAACQAIEFLRPMKTTTPLEEVYKVT
jgi:histidine ammonia-lyase